MRVNISISRFGELTHKTLTFPECLKFTLSLISSPSRFSYPPSKINKIKQSILQVSLTVAVLLPVFYSHDRPDITAFGIFTSLLISHHEEESCKCNFSFLTTWFMINRRISKAKCQLNHTSSMPGFKTI